MKPIARLLFAFEPERAHALGIGIAASIARNPGLARQLHRLLAGAGERVEIAGLSFPNRVGLAAGLDKNANAPLGWWAFGFGFAELGTVTPLPQPGNPAPRLIRYPRQRALLNRMGFNNDGAEIIAARLREQSATGARPPFPVGISIGKNASTPLEDAHADYAKAASVLAPVADFITLNVSSPNTRGLRELQAGEELETLLAAVTNAAPGKPLFVKVAPELIGDSLERVVASVVGRAAGIIATNTLLVSAAEYAFDGGLSGRPLRLIAAARVSEIRRLAGDKLAIVGCGGIDSVEAAQAMLDAGADLLQLYTGLLYDGPMLVRRITSRLRTPTSRAR